MRVNVKFVALPETRDLPWALLVVRTRTPDGAVLGEARLLVLVDRCHRPLPI